MENLKIEYLPVGSLKPYEKNAKKHPADQVEHIANSIREFGFRQPLVIDKDNVLVIGHGRLLAAKKLGLDTVPCVRADDLTDEQIKALRLADNKTNESEWDFDLLGGELDDIFDIDMEQFGFDVSLDNEPQEVVEDDVPEEVETRCKLGDLWQLGSHRLICGDSTDVTVIDRLMDGVKADMVFTDPPYGMNLDTDYSGIKGSKNAKIQGKGGKKYRPVIGDNGDFKPELIKAIFDYFGYCDDIFTWGADYYAELIQGKNDGSWFCWDKRCSEEADKIIGNCFELCWSKKKHKKEIVRIKWMGAFGGQDARNRVHPTQKPIKLAGWFLDRYSKEGQVIIDLFGGSGSTLIACEQLNRKCYMAELDPKYCDVIIQRWENLTGETAVLLNG